MRFISFLFTFFICFSLSYYVVGETLSVTEMNDAAEAVESSTEAEIISPLDVYIGNDARASFINDIISIAEKTYVSTGGRPQRAQNSGDIYVCKNFTVYLFRQTRENYRIAKYPDVPLVIPNNLKKSDCAPYAYGICWQEVSAAEGNPFEVTASFRYDSSLSKEKNRELARTFMQQVQRGDFFQMSAKYYYGTGAHSLVFISDYDSKTDSVHWTDSNMKGYSKNGVRYAYVQFDAEKNIDWFVDAFCQNKRGATLYRLRNDIVSIK